MLLAPLSELFCHFKRCGFVELIHRQQHGAHAEEQADYYSAGETVARYRVWSSRQTSVVMEEAFHNPQERGRPRARTDLSANPIVAKTMPVKRRPTVHSE